QCRAESQSALFIPADCCRTHPSFFRKPEPMSPDLSVHDKAVILSEALPYMQQHDDSIVVVKYGGHAMGDEQVARDFARDIVLLEQAGVNPVVVHGGGPQISEMLLRL